MGSKCKRRTSSFVSSSSRRNRKKSSSDESQYIHLYSVSTDQLFPIMIGKESIHAFTWSTTSMSLFFATRSSWSEEAEQAYENEWKNAIEYREQDRRDTIYRVDIENMNISKIVPLTNISLRVNELICSPDGKQLVFSTESKSMNQERITDYGLYSLDLTKDFPLISSRITNNNASEQNLKWSIDGLVFFEVMNEGSIEGASVDSQGRLYSLNITDRRIERWATQFKGKMEEMVFLYLTN